MPGKTAALSTSPIKKSSVDLPNMVKGKRPGPANLDPRQKRSKRVARPSATKQSSQKHRANFSITQTLSSFKPNFRLPEFKQPFQAIDFKQTLEFLRIRGASLASRFKSSIEFFRLTKPLREIAFKQSFGSVNCLKYPFRTFQFARPFGSIQLTKTDKVFFAVLSAVLLMLLPSLFNSTGEFADLSIGSLQMVTIQQPFKLTKSLTELHTALTNLSKPDGSRSGLFFVNLDNGAYVDYDGHEVFSAASTIKIPIMVSFLAAVDRGACSLDELLEIREDLKTSGSGFLQWRTTGSKIKAGDAANLMMVVSDNTATNMLIDRLGGKDRINSQMRRWGLESTKINNWLVDVEGLNVTSPYDLAYLLGQIEKGFILSKESRTIMYDAMRRCKNRSLLPVGLGPGADIAHKTGTLGVLIGDAGIVSTPDGGKYIVVAHVARKRNDRRANTLIQKMSELVYHHRNYN